MSIVRYSKDHEYIRVDGDIATVGITNYAQEQLGDVVFVDLPAIGKTVAAGAETAVVESVKAASEIYAPVAGTIVEVNSALAATPDMVNADPMGKGWFLKLKIANKAEVDKLMSEAEYTDYLASIS
ncbi:MAG TPA: glycine cleavage system protein GcvH [Beijerinckiaceae bacterium]|nr:glycine cleavage system protein GcvH [Beijerinckiaceae bacterium]